MKQGFQQADAKTLERVIERSYCKDYQRLNLAAVPNASSTLTPSKTPKAKGKTKFLHSILISVELKINWIFFFFYMLETCRFLPNLDGQQQL